MNWTLITGASKNLGASLALESAKKGRHLVLHYNRSKEEAFNLRAECQKFGVSVECIQGDFSSPELLENFIFRYQESFGSTDALVNNVGNYFIGSALETDPRHWETLFQINFHAPFVICRALADSISSNRGHIINIGMLGVARGRVSTYCSAYILTKQSLWALTQCLAKELAPKGVQVNMISPGHLEHSIDLPEDLSKLPTGRPVKGEELARVMHFLMDKENSQITGQNIELAGGLFL